LDPWLLDRLIVDEFNANRAKNLHNDGDVILDESMRAYQPRMDELAAFRISPSLRGSPSRLAHNIIQDHA